jgi:hypothetical protein
MDTAGDRDRHVVTEVGVMCLEDGGNGHKLQNIGGLFFLAVPGLELRAYTLSRSTSPFL